jgi:hypothetical protein
VDGNALFSQTVQKGEDGFALLFLLGRIGFDVEVVVGQERGGIRFVRGAESEFDVVFANILEPDGVGQLVGVVVFGADGFVDDVPGMNAAL